MTWKYFRSAGSFLLHVIIRGPWHPLCCGLVIPLHVIIRTRSRLGPAIEKDGEQGVGGGQAY